MNNVKSLRRRKKRVLLVGDVGDQAGGFHHIGDEAMLYQNYKQYRRSGQYDLTILSWSASHQYLEADEYDLWEMPSGEEGEQRIQSILGQAARCKRWRVTQVESKLAEYLGLLHTHDLLHISGGGNLNSLFPRQLYANALLLQLARLLDRPTLLTSQTIGPLTDSTDRRVASRALDAADVITLRDQKSSASLLQGIGVSRPKVRVGLDDAFFLEGVDRFSLAAYWLPSNEHAHLVRIGISVHPWQGVGDASLYARTLDELANEFPLQIYFIPHVLLDEDTRHDVPFMQSICSQMTSAAPRRVLTRQDLAGHAEPVVERVVKGMTAAMDVVLATRYHGLVFALSSAVPAIALHHNGYSETKNMGILEALFDTGAAEYALPVEVTAHVLTAKLRWLLANRASTRTFLEQKRLELASQADLNLTLAARLLGQPNGTPGLI